MSIYLLYCAHGNELTGTHDTICDTFAIIMRNVSFHMGWKQLQVLPSTMFNSTCWRIDIVLIKDGTHTLIDVVFANAT